MAEIAAVRQDPTSIHDKIGRKQFVSSDLIESQPLPCVEQFDMAEMTCDQAGRQQMESSIPVKPPRDPGRNSLK